MLALKHEISFQGTDGIYHKNPRHQIEPGQAVMPICRLRIFSSLKGIEGAWIDMKPQPNSFCNYTVQSHDRSLRSLLWTWFQVLQKYTVFHKTSSTPGVLALSCSSTFSSYCLSFVNLIDVVCSLGSWNASWPRLMYKMRRANSEL